MVARQPHDEPLAFEAPQIVGGLAAGVPASELRTHGADQGAVVETGEQVGESDDGGSRISLCDTPNDLNNIRHNGFRAPLDNNPHRRRTPQAK